MSSVNKRKLIDQFNIYRSVLTLLVICVSVTILFLSFLSVVNLFNVLRQIIVAGIVGCEMTSAIPTEGIDLSIGSILGLIGVPTSGTLESTENAGAAILAALAVGIGCGAVNGFFVAVCEIPPFISTLGMMTPLRGCVLVYTKGSPIPIRVDAYKFLDKGTVAEVPVPIIILITLSLIAHYMLTQTSYGRSIYAFGDDREVVCLSNISVRFTEWMAHTLNGFIYSIAGMILTARLGSAQSISGTSIEMDTIAAVILDGMFLNGNVGFVLPIMVGAMIMGIVDNILTLVNVNPHAANTVEGVVILTTVLVDKKMKDLSAKAE